jgi:short-subunit dehydrogenase
MYCTKERPMPTLAVVGAGPGLGLAIAKLFGGHGYDVALISRSEERLSRLTTQLEAAGIASEGFTADAGDPRSIASALAAAAERFGAIDVLEYSPYAGLVKVSPQDVTVDNLEPQIQDILYGAVTATQAVLPGMQERGDGSLLFTVGGGAISPHPVLATMNTAQAALRNWVLNLNVVLAETGVYAGLVAIGVMIADMAPEGVRHATADEIAPVYWDLHTARDRVEQLFTK